jgi:microcystin-dependent protein
MSQPYVGEVRMVGFQFAPVGWQYCDGSLLSISEYEALFTLIGTTYGGDGQTTFAVPDLRGRSPIHYGTSSQGSYILGTRGGVETVTLSLNQIPLHAHQIGATTAAGQSSSPSGQTFAANSQLGPYEPTGASASAPILGLDGGNSPHENLMPYLAVNYVISLYGVYPSQN